jgi:transposase
MAGVDRALQRADERYGGLFHGAQTRHRDGILSKKKEIHAAEQGRADVVEKRQAHIDAQPTLPAEKLISLDEMGIQVSMQRTHGLALVGEPLVDRSPVSHGENVTVIGAISPQGVEASMAVKGAITADAIVTFIECFLAKCLRAGHIVLMDNLGAHHAARVIRAIEATGAKVLFIPPYSPEFNPIEKCWAKVKAFLRKARARTVTSLLEALGTALNEISADDAANWFRGAGYP